MKPVIAGNWKMHHGPSETRAFLERFRPGEAGEATSMILFVPAVSLSSARVEIRPQDGLALGAQNIHWEPKGAFTGELSAEMAVDAGATHVLVGHSERRHVFGESDAETALKVAAARRAGLVPVLCVGETSEERNEGRLEEVVLRQLDEGLGRTGTGDPTPDSGGASELMIAYEPVWAIGTGRTATPEDASDAHGLIRRRLAEVVGPEEARTVPVLYGGSVKPGNARELLAASDVDGVLVGGASLDPDSFASIVRAAS